MEYRLTENEAKILRAMGEYGEAYIYELANKARLTPSDVTKTVEHLAKKEFLLYIPDNPFLRLTEKGFRARRSLVEPPSKRGAHPRGGSLSVSIVPDADEPEAGSAAAAASSYDQISAEELDAILDDEINKLK
jgi:DNA-binding MarR family transcriptional regulator